MTLSMVKHQAAGSKTPFDTHAILYSILYLDPPYDIVDYTCIMIVFV